VRIKQLAAAAPAWARKEGPDSDVVLWTRARLARNLADFRFAPRAANAELLDIRDALLKKLRRMSVFAAAAKISFAAPDALAGRILSERGLLDADSPSQAAHAALLCAPGEETCALVNWRDHLRLELAGAGFCAQELCDAAANMADGLSGFETAFDAQFGWLSPAPENAGTGLRVSLTLHLPFLTRSGRAGSALKNLDNLFVAWKSASVGTDLAAGGFYEIFNASSFGRSETETANAAQSAARFLCAAEREARRWTFSGEKSVQAADEGWRADGTPETARIISFEEASKHISAALAAQSAGVEIPVSKSVLRELLILARPAHIALRCPKPSAPPALRDIRRAELIRAAITSK